MKWWPTTKIQQPMDRWKKLKLENSKEGKNLHMHWVPYLYHIPFSYQAEQLKLKLNCNIYFDPFFVRRSLITLKYNLLEFNMLLNPSNHLIVLLFLFPNYTTMLSPLNCLQSKVDTYAMQPLCYESIYVAFL